MKFGKITPFLKRGSKGQNILLTGVPRSGTTLACRLLCDFSQTIALNEPLDHKQFADPSAAKKNIGRLFTEFRESLLKDGTAIARTKGGMITDNAFTPDNSTRVREVKRSVVTFDHKLKDDFTLIMKQCAEFTLILPLLSESYTIFAVVRNPLAILGSWASLNLAVSRGTVSKSDRLNAKFHQAIEDQGEDIFKRQLFILSWYFGQYNSMPSENIIRYEDLVEHPAQQLKRMGKGEFHGNHGVLRNRNNNDYYDKSQVLKMGEALLNTEGEYWKYYNRNDVKELMNEITADNE